MSKETTILTFRRCNKCNSSKIVWSDIEDVNHLCEEHKV